MCKMVIHQTIQMTNFTSILQGCHPNLLDHKVNHVFKIHMHIASTCIFEKGMKCKYQVRSLNSKGAFLVVFWILLLYVSGFPYFNLVSFTETFNCWLFPDGKWLMVIPLSVACLSAPAAGWMADAKFGNYRVFKSGVTFLFLFSALYCLSLVLEALFWKSNKIFLWIRFGLSSSLLPVGGCTCIVTALPLGLDQMPDASASNITCLIAWFAFSLYTGSWLADANSFLKIIAWIKH